MTRHLPAIAVVAVLAMIAFAATGPRADAQPQQRCNIPRLERELKRIVDPIQAATPAHAAARVGEHKARLKQIAAAGHFGAVHSRASDRIGCRKIAVNAYLALTYAPEERRQASDAIALVSDLGVRECEALPQVRGPDIAACALLRTQKALSPTRQATEELAAIQPAVADPVNDPSPPETWRAIAGPLATISRNVERDWPQIADEHGWRRRTICRLVSVVSVARMSSWRPADGPTLDDRRDALDLPYDQALSATAAMLALPTSAEACTEPGSSACSIARRNAMEASCTAGG